MTQNQSPKGPRSDSGWTCRSCVEREAGCNLPADLGMWSDPTDPAATCEGCGEHPPEVMRLFLVLERAARTPLTAPQSPRAPTAPEPSGARPLSLNAFARRIGRSKTRIRALANAGEIRTVPWPGKKAKDAFPLDEVERVEREGIAPRKRAATRRTAAKKAAAEVAAREARAIREYAKD